MEPNKTYIIQHKESGALFKTFTGKKTWTKPHVAKASFNRMLQLGGLKNLCKQGCKSFDEQDVYVLKEIKHKDTYLLSHAVLLLEDSLLHHLPPNLAASIELFLDEVKNG